MDTTLMKAYDHPLINAVYQPEITKVLLDSGLYDVNDKCITNGMGELISPWQEIVYATFDGSTDAQDPTINESIKLLLEAGADCSVTYPNGNNSQPLFLGSFWGAALLVNNIINIGKNIDVNHKNNNGLTAVQLCIRFYLPEEKWNSTKVPRYISCLKALASFDNLILDSESLSAIKRDVKLQKIFENQLKKRNGTPGKI